MRFPPVLYVLFVLGICSCAHSGSPVTANEQSSNEDANKAEQHDMHNSRIALDWNGIYRGSLPCADCESIKTELQLRNDLRFVQRSQYVGKDEKVFEQSGTFEWLKDGNSIRLEDGSVFKIGENFLEMLDQEGQSIKGDLATNYKLNKDIQLFDKTWYLIELNGEPIDSQAKPHIRLHSSDSLLSGSGGCNRLKSKFQLQGNNLRFGPIAQTEKYCLNVTYENTFVQILSKTTTFSLEEDILFLSDSANNQSSKFKFVFFE